MVPANVLRATRLVALLLVLGGCKKATLEDAPDASIRCAQGAHVFCEAGVPPDQGCTIAAGDIDKRLGQIGAGTYPIGCVANFVSDYRDVGGDCVVSDICRCNAPVDGGAPTAHWTCFP
jgi:hypothetical protein